MTILIPDAAFPDDHALEREAAAPEQVLLRNVEDAAGIAAADWAAADAIVVNNRVRLGAAVVALATRCRIVVRAGVGFDNVDIAAWGARGIPVCNVPDYGTSEVADHAIALLLALARGIPSYHAALAAAPRAGWDWRLRPAPMRRLRGQKLLVVGFGNIGKAAARRARGFDLDVGIFDPFERAGVEIALGVRRYDSLAAGLAEADIVTLHAPLDAATRNLMDGAAFAALKPGAILVNTARGGLVDLDALFAALKSGRLAAAGIDVLPVEPPDADHPLLAALRRDEDWLRGRLVLTPHAAFFSADAMRDMRVKAIETALAYLREKRLTRCVNAQHLTAR